MKKLLGIDNTTFLPLSAVIVFAAMIAILFLVKKTGHNTYIGYRAKKAYRGLRRVPSRALIGTGQWHRRWDQMSGSSTYSRDMIKGRGSMLHMA